MSVLSFDCQLTVWLWRRCIGAAALGYQLDRRTVGYLSYRVGRPASVQAMLVRETEHSRQSASLHVGVPHSYLSASLMLALPEADLKARLLVR